DHTLQYYHTAVSSPDHEMPQYTSVGYVDRIQITRYSSDTGRSVPVAHWMERLEPEYWEEETRNNKQAQEASRRNVKIAMSRYNHTGFHSFQLMYGCELMDDGSTRGYWQYGYDGKDFLALDTERRVYYPITDQAQLSAQKWNSPEQRAGKRAKDYLEKNCIEWLKTYMEYSKKDRERFHPVSSRRSGSTMKLHCQVYRFYPRDVDVIWKKNGIDILPEDNRHVLPNSDGTYQLRATAEVTPGDGASYSCHVDHSSLDDVLPVRNTSTSRNDMACTLQDAVSFTGVFKSLMCYTILWKDSSSPPQIRKISSTNLQKNRSCATGRFSMCCCSKAYI
uniref:Ig-like domain-containing protein n=1 Tax=Leptobrachium leishanense TaxID=445787 RepID=A0A8C5WKW1_9ANUR